MIVSRAPFRISFAGGGSDLRAFYRHEPGAVLSTSINQYMYISLHPYFHPGQTLLRYSKTELVQQIADVKHPILREALKLFGVSGVDVSSTADIPAGTGLGSSSTFTVSLIHALAAHTGKFASREFLASTASRIEIDLLGEPIGKQDQYAAAYGGLNLITFFPNEEVTVEPVVMAPEHFEQLQANLMLFYTGDVRSAGDILTEQRSNLESSESIRGSLRRMAALGRQLRAELQRGCIDAMGEILHASWEYKKELASGVSNPRVDGYYELARAAGARGGKLLGAGGGGFLLFYAPQENQEPIRGALRDLREVRIRFEHAGAVIVYSN